MHTVLRKQNIAVENATESTAFAPALYVPLVERYRLPETDSATGNVGRDIGIGEKANATKRDGPAIGFVNLLCWMLSGANAYTVGLTIRGSLTSIISTQRRKTDPHIEDIRQVFGLAFGLRKWTICKSFARTATGSKLTESIGEQKASWANEARQ